jgi:hypothetical protein
MKEKDVYIISPSELSYICYHCSYLKQNYELYNSSISAGITSTLDGIEKKHFLGDPKKISQDLPNGEVIDPYNIVFHSKILKDNEGRKFRLKGKCDALIKFSDGSSGIIDFKTSKFKQAEGDKKSKFTKEDLQAKVNEYDPQLHAYSLLYSNLETDMNYLAEKSTAKTTETKIKSANIKLEKIKKVFIKEAKILGIVFIYPEEVIESNRLGVYFSHQYEPVKVNMKNFKDLITKFISNLYQKNPPPIPDSCSLPGYGKKCLSHKFFYDEAKLQKISN